MLPSNEDAAPPMMMPRAENALDARRSSGDAPCRLRAATAADLDAVEAIQVPYYRADGYPRDAVRARRALEDLLAHPAWGRLRIVEPLDAAGVVAGYACLAFGYSLEFHGRDAFVDELVIDAPWRGRGFGTAALCDALAVCAAEGIRRVHLEVELENARACELYRRMGFVEHGRRLMSREP